MDAVDAVGEVDTMSIRIPQKRGFSVLLTMPNNRNESPKVPE